MNWIGEGHPFFVTSGSHSVGVSVMVLLTALGVFFTALLWKSTEALRTKLLVEALIEPGVDFIPVNITAKIITHERREAFIFAPSHFCTCRRR